MINDRGTKKWTSIMMPEQIKMLQEAIENDLTIEVTYFKDHDFHIVDGRVSSIQTQNRYLQLDDVRINLDDIIEVNL